MNAIEVQNVTKIYRLYNSPRDRLKKMLSLRGEKHHREFYALNDVSFAVEKGQTVGIIGQNGSGKSTLLQIICGVLQPTSGSVKVNGRIAGRKIVSRLNRAIEPDQPDHEDLTLDPQLGTALTR